MKPRDIWNELDSTAPSGSSGKTVRRDQIDRGHAARFAILDEVRAAFAGVPPEELEREAARALAEVRAEMREERARAAEAQR